MYDQYESGNVTVINDNEDYAKVDVNTSKGHIFKRKAIVIADSEYRNEFYIVYANLTNEEKEAMFNLLDAELHDESETNTYLLQRVEELEIKVDDLEDRLISYDPSDNDMDDGEADFYEAI